MKRKHNKEICPECLSDERDKKNSKNNREVSLISTLEYVLENHPKEFKQCLDIILNPKDYKVPLRSEEFKIRIEELINQYKKLVDKK